MPKSRFLYLNYFSNTDITDPEDKLRRYGFCFGFLPMLTDKYEVIFIDHIAVNAEREVDGVKYKYYKRLHNRKWFLPLSLHQDIAKLKPDIIYLQGMFYTPYLLHLKRLLPDSCKIIVQYHAEKIPDNPLVRFLLKMSDPLVDAYVFTAHEIFKQWQNSGLIANDKTVLEQPEISTFFSYDPETPRQKDSYLWVGRLDQNKDPLTVVNAFIEYVKSNPAAKLTMCYGTDELESDVRSLIDDTEFYRHFDLRAKVSHSEMEAIYRTHEFFILASHYEGGPASLIEAMACGCIPIVSDIPAHRIMTKQGSLAYLFEAGSYSSCLEQLLKSREIQQGSIREQILQHFDIRLSFKALAEGLDELVSKLFPS